SKQSNPIAFALGSSSNESFVKGEVHTHEFTPIPIAISIPPLSARLTPQPPSLVRSLRSQGRGRSKRRPSRPGPSERGTSQHGGNQTPYRHGLPLPVPGRGLGG